MSGGEWPADPTDPRCPECGEPVSATATYCMHCESDLPTGDDATTGATVATDESTREMTEADAGMPTVDGPTAGDPATEPTAGDPAATGPTDAGGDHGGALIDPDSLLDDVSTVVVGAVGGLLTAILAGLVAFWLLPPVVESAAFWLGLAAGAGGGLWMARTRTVFGAARKAGYSLGGLLALVPPALGVALDWGSAGEALGGMVVFGIFLWPVALVIAGLGWLLGRGGVDDEG